MESHEREFSFGDVQKKLRFQSVVTRHAVLTKRLERNNEKFRKILEENLRALNHKIPKVKRTKENELVRENEKLRSALKILEDSTAEVLADNQKRMLTEGEWMLTEEEFMSTLQQKLQNHENQNDSLLAENMRLKEEVEKQKLLLEYEEKRKDEEVKLNEKLIEKIGKNLDQIENNQMQNPLRTENLELREKLEALWTLNGKLSEKLNAIHRKKNADLQTIVNQNVDISVETVDTEQQTENAKIAEFEEVIKNLKCQIEQQNANVSDEAADIEQPENENVKIAELEEVIKNLESQIEKQNVNFSHETTRMDHPEIESEKIAELEKVIKNLQGQIEQHERIVEAKQNEALEAVKALSEELLRKKELSKELEAEKLITGAMEEENASLKGKIAQLEGSVESDPSRISDSEQEKEVKQSFEKDKQILSSMLKMKKEAEPVQNLEEENKKLQAKVKQYEEIVQSMDKELTNTKVLIMDKMKRFKDKNVRYKRQVKEKILEIKTLKEKLEALQKKSEVRLHLEQDVPHLG